MALVSQRTTVWYFVPALSYGGAERTLVDLANNLDHERYSATIWTIFEENPLAAELDGTVTLRTLGARGQAPGEMDHYVASAENPTDYFRAPIRFFCAVRRARPDIIQSFLFFDNVIARLAGILSPQTTVVSGVRLVDDDQSFARLTLDRLTLPLADYIISNSQSGAELAKQRGVPTDRVSVIWNGRDVDAYTEVDSGNIRSELGLPDEAPIVGTVGRLIERKGHHDLLEAWPTVRSHFPDARLLLVGDGPAREALVSRAKSLDCCDSTVFTGIRDDIPALLALFDVFVFPSYFEGLPGALIEAMAAGLPIVTTPVNGCSELIESYEHGLHVNVGQPTEFAWATIRLLENPDFAADLGSNAHQRASTFCSIERMVTEFEELYDRLQ